jgi:hypothetical protein
MRALIAVALLTMSWPATAQENLVATYNTCVTGEFMKGLVIVGLPGWTQQRALDQAEGKCGDLLDRALSRRAGGRNTARRRYPRSLTLNKIQLEKRLLSMFPEHHPGRNDMARDNRHNCDSGRKKRELTADLFQNAS